MLSLTIDGMTENIDAGGFKTLKELLDLLTAELNKEGRAVTQISVNGNRLKDNDLYTWLNGPTADISSFSVESQSREALIDDQLQGLSEHIDKLANNIEQAAEFFRLGNEAESQRYFSAVLEGMRWFNYSLDLIVAFLKLDIRQDSIGSELLHQRLDEVTAIINSMGESQERNDWIMLADQLEYELLPVLRKWQKVIPHFKQYI